MPIDKIFFICGGNQYHREISYFDDDTDNADYSVELPVMAGEQRVLIAAILVG